MPLFARGTFRALADSMHKNVHCGAHGCLQAIGLKRQEIEEFLYLLVFGILRVNYDLDRTGMKI